MTTSVPKKSRAIALKFVTKLIGLNALLVTVLALGECQQALKKKASSPRWPLCPFEQVDRGMTLVFVGREL